MTTWDFALVTPNSDWVVAEVTPQTATFWDITKAEEPRLLVDAKGLPVNTTVAMVYTGAIKVLTPLAAVPKDSLRLYRYKSVSTTSGDGYIMTPVTPIGTEKRELESPFYSYPSSPKPSNIVLCSLSQIILNVETADPKYQRAHLISEEAQRWIMPAQAFYRANPGLFSKIKARDNRSRLLQLTSNENPFLVAAAFRALAQVGAVDTALITERLRKADSLQQAIIVYSLLLYSPVNKTLTFVAGIEDAIAQAHDSKQIEGMVIGAKVAYRTLWDIRATLQATPLFDDHGRRFPPKPPRDEASLALSKSLQNRLTEKLKVLGIHTETDKFLSELLGRVDPPLR